jgi:hypothetical protein
MMGYDFFVIEFRGTQHRIGDGESAGTVASLEAFEEKQGVVAAVAL